MALLKTTAPPKGPSSLKRLVKEHPLVVYFVMAFGISWMLWIPLVASAHGLLAGGNAFSYFHLLGSLGPMLAALIVTGIVGGAVGLRELGARMVKWRVGIFWWALALFGPAALYGLSAVLLRLFSGAWPNMSQFGQTDEYPQLGLILFWIANIAFYGFGEETGWRGFALPRLQNTHSALVASLILSVFWALWHVPLFLSLPNLMNMGIGGTIGWVLFIVTGSILLTWMYNSTRGSILILAVFHGTLDIVINSPSSGALATVNGVLFTVLGVLVLLVTGPASLSRSGKQTIGAQEPCQEGKIEHKEVTV
ncbi:MAG TPA: type II CAAX endopeptidase family protein [Ktedonobacteraceae bacterium]